MDAGHEILVNEEFISPLQFNQFLVNFIPEHDKIEFERTLKHYGVKNVLDARDCRGASMLHIVAEYDCEEITKYLIELEFDINLKNDRGQTPLMIAVKKRNFMTAKVLLNNNAEIWASDIFGMNVLQIVLAIDPIMSYNPDFNLMWPMDYWEILGMMFNKLNDSYASDCEKIADYLLKIHCPLTHVVFMENSEVMDTMIKKGISINVKECYWGRSAMHLAVQFWKLEIVKILLKNGADINILDFYKKTPIMCLYDNVRHFEMMPPCEVELVKVLLQYKKTLSVRIQERCFVNEMYWIFRYGSKDAIHTAIMESEENLFLERNKDKFTLLHVIAENCNPGIEDLLKGRKIDLNGTSRYGETALGHALKYGNVNIVEYLLSKGANIGNENTRTYPLRRSFMPITCQERCIEREFKCMKLILEYGLDDEIFVRGKDQMFTLNHAHTIEHFGLVDTVLAQIAIKESMGVKIPEHIRPKLQSKKYYNSCVKELQEAKISIIFGSTSVFEFLTASDEKILLYARNRNLVSNLSELIAHVKLHAYYLKLLNKCFSKIMQIAELRQKVERVICRNIGIFYGNNSIITRKVIEFLDDESVQKLVQEDSLVSNL